MTTAPEKPRRRERPDSVLNRRFGDVLVLRRDDHPLKVVCRCLALVGGKPCNREVPLWRTQLYRDHHRPDRRPLTCGDLTRHPHAGVTHGLSGDPRYHTVAAWWAEHTLCAGWSAAEDFARAVGPHPGEGFALVKTGADPVAACGRCAECRKAKRQRNVRWANEQADGDLVRRALAKHASAGTVAAKARLARALGRDQASMTRALAGRGVLLTAEARAWLVAHLRAPRKSPLPE
jgi:hypothetical protein